MNSIRLGSFASLCLKVLGGVLIVSSLIDYLLAAFPLMPLENAWQINFTNQMVSGGINPMLGIASLMLAVWIDVNTGLKPRLKASITDLRFLSFIFSLVLGIIFFLLVPLHIDNMQGIREEAIAQIEQQTQQRQLQVQNQYNELQVLAQNPEAKQQLEEEIKRIDQAINSGQLQGEQLATIQERKAELLRYQNFTNNPEALNQRLQELQETVQKFEAEQRKEAGRSVLKDVLQVSFRSVLLGIGYLLIGWFGVQNSLDSPVIREASDTVPSPSHESEE